MNMDNNFIGLNEYITRPIRIEAMFYDGSLASIELLGGLLCEFSVLKDIYGYELEHIDLNTWVVVKEDRLYNYTEQQFNMYFIGIN